MLGDHDIEVEGETKTLIATAKEIHVHPGQCIHVFRVSIQFLNTDLPLWLKQNITFESSNEKTLKIGACAPLGTRPSVLKFKKS